MRVFSGMLTKAIFKPDWWSGCTIKCLLTTCSKWMNNLNILCSCNSRLNNKINKTFDYTLVPKFLENFAKMNNFSKRIV